MKVNSSEAYRAYLKLNGRFRNISADLQISLRVLACDNIGEEFDEDFEIYLSHLRELKTLAVDFVAWRDKVDRASQEVQDFVADRLKKLENRILDLSDNCGKVLSLILATKSGNVVIYVIRVIRTKVR